MEILLWLSMKIVLLGVTDSMQTGEFFPIHRSNLYGVWLEEQEHIQRNKWFLSEKAGFDVGMSVARHDWHMRYRPQWINELRASGRYPS